MDICTLKISLFSDICLIKINDLYEYKKSNKSNYIHLNFDEIFCTSKLVEIFRKISSNKSYIYFRYNVHNLLIHLRVENKFYKSINNKFLLANVLIKNMNETQITIDSMYPLEINNEINILIKIITISKPYSILRTHSDWFTSENSIFKTIYNTGGLCVLIKFTKNNPFISLIKVEDYDKKIKSIKLPLYDSKKKINYAVVFDFYTSYTNTYMLIISEIINISTNNSYKIILDKECTKCLNRINGCELNMISKVHLCCKCNSNIVQNDLNKFFNNKSYYMQINTTDFPSYIKDNFNSYHYLYI
jgi:hypothetical protein